MKDDEKIVCFGALKTFYNDIEKVFVKNTDITEISKHITNEEIDKIMEGDKTWQEEH